jgi:hypothetical protein
MKCLFTDVDVVCEGNGVPYTEQQLYSLFSPFAFKRRTGLFFIDSMRDSVKYQWNVFPLSKQEQWQTSFSLKNLSQDHTIEFNISIDKFDDYHIRVASDTQSHPLLVPLVSLSVQHPKDPTKSIMVLSDYNDDPDCFLVIPEDDLEEFIVYDNLCVEVGVVYTQERTNDHKQFLTLVTGRSIKLPSEPTVSRYKWTPLISNSNYCTPTLLMDYGGQEFILNIQRGFSIPEVTITAPKKCNSKYLVGFFILNVTNLERSIFSHGQVSFVRSKRHTLMDAEIWKLHELSIEDGDEFVHENRMEVYASVTKPETPSFGYEDLPEQFNGYINAKELPGVSYHGFVEAIGDNKYRFADMPILRQDLKGVLQIDVPKTDTGIYFEVTLDPDTFDYELSVGLAPPKYSSGHCQQFGESIGFSFNYSSYGAVVGGSYDLCEDDGTNGPNTVGVCACNNTIQFFMPSGKTLDVKWHHEDLVPTITGVGCDVFVNCGGTPFVHRNL